MKSPTPAEAPPCNHPRSPAFPRRHLAGASSSGRPAAASVRPALAWMLHQEQARAAAVPEDPLAPRPPHFPAKAQRVIYLFMHGGPSHLERSTPSPTSSGSPASPCPRASARWRPAARSRTTRSSPPSGRSAKYGQSGIEVSDFLPHIADCADDLAVIRSCWADSVNHPQAVYQMNTGSILMGKPSLGSWVGYGLGTENQDLPAFVVLPDPGGGIKGGPPAYGSGFLPASYQGTLVRGGDSPILDLRPPAGMTPDRAAQDARPDRPAQRTATSRARGEDSELRPASRPTSWPTGCRPPRPRPSTSRARPAETRRLYGLDDTPHRRVRHALPAGPAAGRAGRPVRPALLGRRRTAGTPTTTSRRTTPRCAAGPTSPSPACSTDLKRRGLLDDTLVIWGGEFGRMPMSRAGQGPRPQPARLLRLAGRRRHQGGHRPRRDRRRRPPRRGRPRPRPRPPRHDPPPAGPRPHPARPSPTTAATSG